MTDPPARSPARILVTGARGFLGAPAIAALAARGHEVHAVTRSPVPPSDDLTWHTADLLQDGTARALVRDVRPTHLLHLAWETTHGAFWASPENVTWLSRSLDLVTAFAESGGDRIVAAGTCAEYAWDGSVCTEYVTPMEPATLYGACKHAFNVAASSYALHCGIGFAWGRVFYPYGPGEPPGRFVSSVANAIAAGQTATTTSGDKVRDFVYVDDVAEAFAILMDAPYVGAINICTGMPMRLGDVAAETARQLNGTGLLQVGEESDRTGEPRVLIGDGRRLAALGWVPSVSIEQGIALTIEGLGT